jgi:hypothetical protein
MSWSVIFPTYLLQVAAVRVRTLKVLISPPYP